MQHHKKIWWALLLLMPWPVAWGIQRWRPTPMDPTAHFKPQFKQLALETRARMVRLPDGQFAPNRFALYDMAGNAWQWCADWYTQDYYGKSPAANRPGPSAGEVRVRRGGCWISTAHLRSALRVSHRNYAPPGESASYTGFRCAKNDQ
jgi:formylglycine-generating enzyme required for sulfatase activity